MRRGPPTRGPTAAGVAAVDHTCGREPAPPRCGGADAGHHRRPSAGRVGVGVRVQVGRGARCRRRRRRSDPAHQPARQRGHGRLPRARGDRRPHARTTCSARRRDRHARRSGTTQLQPAAGPHARPAPHTRAACTSARVVLRLRPPPAGRSVAAARALRRAPGAPRRARTDGSRPDPAVLLGRHRRPAARHRTPARSRGCRRETPRRPLRARTAFARLAENRARRGGRRC